MVHVHVRAKNLLMVTKLSTSTRITIEMLRQVENLAYLGMLHFHSTLKADNEKELLVTADQWTLVNLQ